MKSASVLSCLPLVVLLTACDREAPPREPEAPATETSVLSPRPVVSPEAINASGYEAPPDGNLAEQTASASLARAQVLLDRAGFSPGVTDGRYGENVRQAIAAFQRENGMTVDGRLSREVWDRLVAGSPQDAVSRYVLTTEDVAGPFTPNIPEGLEAQAGLERLGYTSAAELVAERFHMDEQFLREMNPNADFSRAGTEIFVTNPRRPQIATEVARIEVDRDEKAVKAFAEDGTLLAFYPATIGSQEQPTPEGRMTVNGVARDPTYTYDPRRVSYAGDRITRRLTIPAGPNNPVGLVWIDLSRDTYGIHGTPNPDIVGKNASNGCVRLTNWDAQHLAAAVRPGVVVEFV
ncbi:L,D-transpeptidase [Brevundimonas sp.]|uniref:L,D-transpeptidase family protein n=1 Tax=Brevundimonas sp. TaxID=1871086 RepID=UPI0025F9EB06|nr:L,D-transpeptidase [Brevundimonas sp.]